MAIKSNDNIRKFGKNFTSRHTTVFTDAANAELAVEKVDLVVTAITQICWATDTVGYIELLWEGVDGENETIAYLAGNGKWDLGKSTIMKPEDSTGKILISTFKFKADDNYTVILQGTIE